MAWSVKTFLASVAGKWPSSFGPPPKEPTKRSLQDAEAIVDPSRNVKGWSISPYNPSWLVTRKGLGIYDTMKRDEQIKAALKFKKDSVLGSGWEVTSPGDEDDEWEVTRFVRDALTKIDGGPNRFLTGIMSALDYGFSVHEKIYAEEEKGEWKGKLVLHRANALKPHFLDFVSDTDGSLLGVVQTGFGTTPASLPPAKVIVYTHAYEFGNWYGQSDLEAAYRSWWVKDNAYKWLATVLERYGMPPLLALYDPNAYQGTQIEALKSIVKNIQNATMGVVPRANKDALEFWTQQMGKESTSIFLAALERFDQHIARAILVPSMIGMSADEGATGSLARSESHQDSFMRVISSLQLDIATVVMNAQVIPQLVDLNFPNVDSYPVFGFVPFTDEQRNSILTTWTQMVKEKVVSRIEDDERHIRKVLGFPENENIELEPLPSDAANEAKAKAEADKEKATDEVEDEENVSIPPVPDEEQTVEMRQFAADNDGVWVWAGERKVCIDREAYYHTPGGHGHDYHTPGGHGHDQRKHGNEKLSTKDPMTMRPAEINKELDMLGVMNSNLMAEFIAAGRGQEPLSEYLTKSDPLALRARSISERQEALRGEVVARMGPGYYKLPVGRGFGPRKK